MSSQAIIEVVAPRRETVLCHVCSTSGCEPYLEGRGYTVVQCRECRLIYVNPQPSLEELEEYYANYDLGEQWVGGEDGFDRRVRKIIFNFKKKGSVLDIGCGAGSFLCGLREAGFDVFGVEPSESGYRHAKSANRLDAFHGTVESFLDSRVNADFDVITMLNVLEHLKNPRDIVLRLRKLMRDRAILVVGVPDVHLHMMLGEARRALGIKDPFWMDTVKHPLVAIDPPHHLTSFEPKTISQFLSNCGFETVFLRNAPIMFNADGWKNVAKRVVHTFSESLYWLTFRRVILGYSILAVGVKR